MPWPYHPDLLATPVPRYTSFPTAAEFEPTVSHDDVASALATSTGEVSLYVHIPFCEKICWYCGCNTAAANRVQRLQTYLAALHQEITLVASLLGPDATIGRIAYGGGSPNALAPEDFLALHDALLTQFPVVADPVVSIELDPRTLSDDWRSVLRRVRVTNASMGVQTFAPRLQAAIGRVQPEELIARGVELLRDAGVQSLNFDLMYGLPGQGDADLAETLALAARYGADRIALFGYAHVPHMLPRQRRIDASALPGQEARFAMASDGYRQLCDAGYVPVGFDHFALPGDPLAQAALNGNLRRNFQGFTDDQANVLIGLGASAISSFPALHAQNEKNAGRYRMILSQGRLPAALGVRRSATDIARGAVIESLLCHGRANVAGLVDKAMEDRLRPFLARDLAYFDGDALVIRTEAVAYMRSIAAVFDPYRVVSTRKFSTAI
ncbi:MAG: oxygen-independent coproporphyrinogen III oxidase [Caenibius sp.]